MSTSPQAVICEEVFDDSSHPSVTEIHDYASKIGIDPDSEPQLLPLAEEGLMRPLPPGWKPCYDDKRKSYYYHNNISGKTQWEHPLDNIYRGLVVKARTESQSLSLGEPTEDATYTRDDLPSYEEPPPLPLFNKTRHDIKLSPLKSKPPLDDASKHFVNQITLVKQKSEENPLVAMSKHRNSISFDEKQFKSEMTVVGGGSAFLKSNKKFESGKEAHNPLRSILRDNLKGPDEIEDDDKKSVRFNMEPKTTTLIFSDESENEVEEKPTNVISVKVTNNRPMLKSRFTIFSVEDDYKPEDTTPNGNLKLVKPDPKDFIKPELELDEKDKGERDPTLSDSDESIINQNKDIIASAEKTLHEAQSTADKSLNFDSIKTDDLLLEESFKAHRIELDQLLSAEKAKYESIIKEELSNLRKEMEARLSGALAEERRSLEAKYEEEKGNVRENYEVEFKKWEKTMGEKFEAKRKQIEIKQQEKMDQVEQNLVEKFQKTQDELIVSHNAILDQMKQNHEGILGELQKDFRSEEDIIRREHQKQISDLKIKVTRDVEEKSKVKDTDEERLYEKVRCEKRLLEDKYRCLKDKYLKLKTEVKLSIEKRNRKREQNLTTTTTTGSETEKSPSGKKDRTPAESPSTKRRSSPKHTRSSTNSDINKHKIKTIFIQDQDTSASDRSYKNDDKFNCNDSQIEYDSSDVDVNPSRSRKKLFSRLKGSSTSRLNNNIKYRDNQQQQLQLRPCSPVENLRKQLQKLEDLEDQFPQNAQGDTYHLRYPFSDGQKFEGSSELEFFRHRIHLERDSISRAKESLKQQKYNFKQRQNELKLKHGATARHTLKQLYQEEKDLTDMEVSLHRTRSLLGEKVIRLRHLEQSLKRATIASDEVKQEDATLSDLSSHSASSGISSTEFIMTDSPILKGAHFKESSEIIQSLENLNSEIREIWDVLNKQHQASSIARVLPPLPYPDFGWPLLAGAVPVPPSIPTLADRLQNYRQHIALANAQSTMVTHDPQGATTTLVERTKNLRQWLRQTTTDTNVDPNITQASL